MAKNPTILVATDLSARCDRAIDRAMMIAESQSARLLIVHIIEKGEFGKDLAYEQDLKAEIARDFPSTTVTAEIIVGRGSVPKMIAKIAERENCSLIVTGVARMNSLRDYILGTLVSALVRQSAIPVLIVKKRPLRPYQKMLAATDFSSCSLHALRVAADQFPKLPIRLEHAFQVPYGGILKSDQVAKDTRAEVNRDMKAFLKEIGDKDELLDRLETHIAYGQITSVVTKRLSASGADLFVIGTHGKSGFAHASIGSIAADLMSWVPVDTLAVRETR